MLLLQMFSYLELHATLTSLVCIAKSLTFSLPAAFDHLFTLTAKRSCKHIVLICFLHIKLGFTMQTLICKFS
ncbi:hypothetical protein XELAEV_18010621mg [Xenopus laevis]|uniref:Uncharacterized protein n=1 Tax=Xenopus laevis TaxID=8355 RepID=A0A974I1Q0_XENLA|nr:hypothetical protein XELAEV_18010621mg [Xenopus laevis]